MADPIDIDTSAFEGKSTRRESHLSQNDDGDWVVSTENDVSRGYGSQYDTQTLSEAPEWAEDFEPGDGDIDITPTEDGSWAAVDDNDEVVGRISEDAAAPVDEESVPKDAPAPLPETTGEDSEDSTDKSGEEDAEPVDAPPESGGETEVETDPESMVDPPTDPDPGDSGEDSDADSSDEPDEESEEPVEITDSSEIEDASLGTEGDAVVEAALDHEDVEVTFDREAGEYVTTNTETGKETGRYSGKAPAGDTGGSDKDAGEDSGESSGNTGGEGESGTDSAPSLSNDNGAYDGEAAWVDGKEPLEQGSLDMPYLVSGRDVDSALEDVTPKNPGTGLTAAGDGKFLPTTGDPEADRQIKAFEEHLTTVNDGLLMAPEGGFLTGAPLHNLAESVSMSDELVSALEKAQSDAQSIYTEGVGDPAIDASSAETAEKFTGFGELGANLQTITNSTARAGDGHNAVAHSVSAATQDAYSQIASFAQEHDQWESSPGSGNEPEAQFSFITQDLDGVVGGVSDTLGSLVLPEVKTAAAPYMPENASNEPGGSDDVDKEPPNAGGSTPPASSPPASGGVGGGSTGGGITAGGSGGATGSSESVSSGGGPDRGAAERLADMLTGNQGGGQSPVQGGTPPMPQMPNMQQPEMPQMSEMPQMEGMDPAASGGMPQDPAASGMTMTDDPYEALLNPATHLTRDFAPGDMSQIRESNATGRDAAMVRPYTAEARGADGMLSSPNAAGPGASTPRPGALGADMKPLDKDGDGKVDDDAVAATAENMLDEDGNVKEIDTAVIVDGEEHPVTVDDPRLLEMMNAVGGASEDEPLEILDAAEEAGVPLESYGEMLDPPTDAKPGDVVVSSKGNGFYLGEGEVLLESGEVVELADVLELRPPQSGIFRLELPELPDEVDGPEDEGSDGVGDKDDGEVADGNAGPDDANSEDDGEGAQPTEGGEAPPTEDDGVPDAEAPQQDPAPTEGGGSPEPAPEPIEDGGAPDPAAEAHPEPMPDPAIADEFEDLDGDGIPDDNNGNGTPDHLEPLPEGDPVAEPEESPEPEFAPEPAAVPEEDSDPAPEPESADESEPESDGDEREPSFEGSANMSAGVEDGEFTAKGSAEATIREVDFEGEPLG